MSEEKVLTKEIAEQFLADADSVGLSEFTAIADDAAESLSKHEGRSLRLDGLTQLSPAASQGLSKFHGSLEFYSLKELSDAAAESLGQHQGRSLRLNCLTELSDAAAKSLSGAQASSLFLSGLPQLSDAAAASLSEFRGRRIDLYGLTELSDAAAESLSKFEGKNLILNLDNLPASAAQILRDAGHE